MQENPFVVFCLPTLKRQLEIETHMAAMEASCAFLIRGLPAVWRYLGGDPYLPKVRDRLVSEAIVKFPQATDFFYIDDDVGGWTAEHILGFIARDEDIVAGVYPEKAATDDLQFPCQLLTDDQGNLIERDGLLRAAMAPTGFMRVKRRVFEKIIERSGWYYDKPIAGEEPVKCWAIHQSSYIPDDEDLFRASLKDDFAGDVDAARKGRFWSEDFFLCARWISMGGEVWVYPDISFTHAGRKVWRANFQHTVNEYKRHRGALAGPKIAKSGAPNALLDDALRRALAGDSELPEEVLAIDGMSGLKYRMFINNLMRLIPNPQYLEIGSWQGSTAIAAGYGMSELVTCIENWSEYGGPRQQFYDNIGKWCAAYQVYEGAFEEIDYSELPTHNVFFYDGPHTYAAQFGAVTRVLPALADEYYLIVDDWNVEQVRAGTRDGLEYSGQEVVSSIEIRTARNPALGERSDWHNGYFIAHVRKPKEKMAEAAE